MSRPVSSARAALARAEEKQIALRFGPGAVIPVNGDPAELLVPVWRRGDEVLYAHPSQLRVPEGQWDAVARATDDLTVESLRYQEGRITLEEFERRAEAIIKREDEG